ncbi:Quinone oxidoreductase [Paraburkholderia caribensis MBA4]|uniref:Quinone oxidoreductase n=1 Tax=Paraburkholderia caribensis MBA4 TaxID=1323664 RepID=A0A0P0RIH9_9BURK|nr:zinc-binding dehydrogenase [Paraburkholderia caribensis]ALL68367.1 Quinone oxidoreductase [Paraburkholderia caribensis MBA4]
MKASIMKTYGGPEVLAYEEVETPRPGAGQVLIKVLAAGVNRLDHYLRAGAITQDLALPHVLGSDAVGTVEALGEGATRFQVGDQVTVLPGYPLDAREQDFAPLSAAPSYTIRGIAEWGAYAEYMVVPERWVIRDTSGLMPEQAATLPMPLVTGVRAVVAVGGVKSGEWVLVHAGASGTGSISIQVARALGARVAATVRTPEKAEFVRELGAERVFPLSEDFAAKTLAWTGGKGVDVVIDNLGGEILTRSLDALAPLGRLVTMGMVMGGEATLPIVPLFFGQKQIRGTKMGDMADLELGLSLVREGKVKPTLDRSFSLAEASKAHEYIAGGKARGSVVLIP